MQIYHGYITFTTTLQYLFNSFIFNPTILRAFESAALTAIKSHLHRWAEFANFAVG